jgi:hypothetical protein
MPEHHDPHPDTVDRSLKQIAHSMQDLTRRVEDISNSPLTRAPARTIAIGVAIGVLAGTILITGMLFLLGLPSPW